MTDGENVQNSGPGSGVDYDPFSTAPTVEVASTFAQREMWLSAQAGAEAVCAYHESFSIHLTGPVDDHALLDGLQALADCHEALRGHFSEDGERFIIEPAMTVPIARHDLSSLPLGERAASLARLQVEDAATPYDLHRGPLFRAAIVRLDAQERVVMLSANHAVCDGWSLDVLLADLGRLYSAFVGGAPLPTPPRHGFSDYVRHCQSPEYAVRIDSSRAFWRKAFEVLPSPLALPHDGHRPVFRSYDARHSLHALPSDLLARVKEFSRAQGLSFFSVLLSAFAALFHRISGQNDLVIGIPVAGHPEVGMEDCVGHLVNLVPVRSRVEPGLSFLDLCRAIHTAVLDARENASVSFGEIVAHLAVPHDPSRVPLIAATFTHAQRYAPGKLVFAGCSVEYHLNPRCFETFEFDLNAIESREGLQLLAHANSDLYTQAWLDWRLREIECVLRDGCSAPATAVDKLALLPGDEISLASKGFNRTERDYPAHLTVHELFASQAERTPQRIAIRLGEQQVSFAELEARANRLAHALRRRGVGRGMLVGLCLERSVDMVAALLAVLKAGAGYIPLDPAFPADRLAFMIEDSGLALVVSESELAVCHGCAAERTLALDTAADEPDRDSPLASDQQAARAEDVAYVLYTSGSTGRPKGVRVSHRAAVNFLTSMQREPGLGPDDRLLAVTTLSFDIALLELMLPLSVGAQVVLASHDDALDGMALQRLLEMGQVTVMQATPATWRLLIESGWQGRRGFKALCGGEALSLDLAESLLTRVGELWNMYGPTETTVWSTCWRVAQPRQGISIGRPIANTSIWILDSQHQLCPIGVPGEIYIGGDGVALGYLNRPELTSERFIADPFSSTPGARMYRTGDLGRWRADGLLECLGRTDFQVKVRGFRIELGEIEAVLMDDASVRKAAVTVHTDALGDTRIVAYVVYQPRQTRTGSEMRRRLASKLPDYMLPHIFVELETLPLTANGKVDRRTLPPPFAQEALAGEEHVEPRTEVERAIAALWREMLKVERVSVRDNFFALGGHSLLSAQMVAQLCKRTGHRLSLRSVVFETLEQLAAHCGPAAQPTGPT